MINLFLANNLLSIFCLYVVDLYFIFSVVVLSRRFSRCSLEFRFLISSSPNHFSSILFFWGLLGVVKNSLITFYNYNGIKFYFKIMGPCWSSLSAWLSIAWLQFFVIQVLHQKINGFIGCFHTFRLCGYFAYCCEFSGFFNYNGAVWLVTQIKMVGPLKHIIPDHS